MAFWGTEVKPGKPFTHTNDSSRGRLHISQATLGLGSATNKSVVQCNVGNKSPVFLCSLFPEKTESLQLHIEFEEAEEVMFSVIGPRSVHLTGYYVGGGRHFTPNDESESYGEDIADTETERSDRSDEDVYDDSFIDDGEPSPVSDSGVEDSFSKKKTKKAKGKSRRLRKTYQLSESDDDNCLQGDNNVNGKDNVVPKLDSEDEDWFPISSLCKPNTSPRSKKLEAKGKVDKKASETCKIEDGGDFFKNSNKETDEAVVEDDTKRVGEENGAVSKKKRKEQRKKGNSTETSILKEDQGPQDEARVDKLDQNLPTKSEPQQAANTKETDLLDNTSLPSAEVDPENVAKSVKKKKRQRKDKTFEVDGVDQGNIVKEDNEQSQKQASNGRAELPHNLSLESEVGYENSTKPKKKRKGRSKGQATPEADTTHHSSVVKEDNNKQDETRADKLCQDLSVKNKQSEKDANDMSCDAEQLASESQSKKKKRKRNKTQ